MFYIFKITIDILQASQLLGYTIDSHGVYEILDSFVDSSDYLTRITEDFSSALNTMIDQNEISYIDRNTIRSKEQSKKAIIVKNDRIFIEQDTFSEIIQRMTLSSDAVQILKALDACDFLIHTNGLQDPLQILDATGKKILLRTYCFTISILSESLQKRISFPSNDEYADYILSSDDVPSDEFLPIIQCGSGAIAGKIIRKEKESNNHMLITGFSGYGNTYALCHLAMRLKHLGHKVIAFDSTGSFSKERIMKHLPQSIVDANFVFRNIEDDGLPVDVFYTSESEMKNRIERITGLLSAGAANVTSSQMASLSSVLIKIKDEQITPESILSELSQTHASKIIKRRYEALLQALAQYTSADLPQSWNDFLGKSEIIIVSVPTLYAQERNALVDILLASLFNYQKQNSNQPLDLLIDELQNENTTEQSPLDQIIAVGRNHAMSIIAATQHFKLNQRLKTMIGNIDTKLFFRPTSNSEDTVIQYLNHRKLSRDYLMKMERGDCILEGNLYNKSRNTNQHAVIIGHFLDYTE